LLLIQNYHFSRSHLFDDTISHFIDSGLILFWHKRTKQTLRKGILAQVPYKINPKEPSKKIGMSKLNGVFGAWIILAMISFILFCFEKLKALKSKKLVKRPAATKMYPMPVCINAEIANLF